MSDIKAERNRILMEQTQSKIVPLSYEQEVHSLLCAAKANTEGLIHYLQTQANSERGDDKKLTQKCIAWKSNDLQRINALIPKALERRDATHNTFEAGMLEAAKAVCLQCRDNDALFWHEKGYFHESRGLRCLASDIHRRLAEIRKELEGEKS